FYNTEVQMFLNLNVIQRQNQQLSTYAQLLEKEKQQREEELEQRSRELTSYTLQEVKYSRFLEEIRQQIQQDSLPTIRRIPGQITTYLHGEDKWSYFKDVFENVHPQFFERITDEFPSLSSNDLRLMALLKMNLSTKEIADILGISPQSVNTARYRLRKRLNLKPEDDLESRIRNL
ncbi:helix-turn-helix transcriptional regulator, partial [Siphonobacter sp.]|uniref:helix-turn-helix transcriptional regulator n=1 Tax=Siphonobacter sp. TaxID=1869184 RepID=UPI003B3B90F7